MKKGTGDAVRAKKGTGEKGERKGRKRGHPTFYEEVE
jgi:hypothetical protein